ncbi:MupA/Atu3671 family FMN-dependent luciferase-like monooxygenase [Sphingomonas arantia]|uniref:MupA/Atu3671 family FMN-dependent luciferase-like monooxygenase n=1 Tax=Sphingomonas arantia TaxID=1460676 RepID=A0ABW4U5P3_9SPHN
MTPDGLPDRGPTFPALPVRGPRWRCVLIGSETLLMRCGDMLIAAGHRIVAVVSDAPAILSWAEEAGIAVTTLAQLPALAPFDYLFSITNLSVLSAETLALPRHAAINFHDGVLPDYAGLNTPAWALLNGERRHGVTWHAMTAEVDRGNILVTRSFGIEVGETAHSLNTRCLAEGIASFAALIDGLAAGTIAPRPQDAPPTRYYSRADRPFAAAMILWDRPADAIAAMVRALDFGGHRNPLGMPKTAFRGTPLLVVEATPLADASTAAPGTIVRADRTALHVATGTTDLALVRIAGIDGRMIALPDAIDRFGLCPGGRLEPATDLAALSVHDAACAGHEHWWRRRLAQSRPPMLDLSTGEPAEERAVTDDAVDGHADSHLLLAAAVACLARVADRSGFEIGFSDPVFAAQDAPVAHWVARRLPLRVDIDWQAGLGTLAAALETDIRRLHRHIGYAIDLVARSPELAGIDTDLPVAVTLVDRLDDADADDSATLTLAIRTDGRGCRWIHDPARLDMALFATIRSAFHALLAAGHADPDRPVALLPLMADADLARMVHGWNQTAAPWRDDACVHHLFAEQAARTPDAPALTCDGVTLNYADLDARANRFARHLASLGVGRGTLVGLHLERSLDMVVALIGIHKAGGAYVPLDPAYPAARIAHMIADSAAPLIVSRTTLAATLPPGPARVLCVDQDADVITLLPDTAFDGGAEPADLAYVIYTSGSTGLPKGVMVEHRNVANFFAGMDALIKPGGVWLAVTSLSFDISVLELCWTVARGAHVVIAPADAATSRATAAPRGPVAFSLFYFGNADSGDDPDPYRLLLDGARFADDHGFSAVWTPERHFHAFGGLYPNPAVTGAAIAAITTRVAIRGGSVVVPLHHPLRVAEEWALVDTLSHGRAGIAFAAGWQPDDFVLRPDAFADRPAALMAGIDAVRGLWRGEPRSFPGPLGSDVAVRSFPRPVQPELPFWITTAGNPDSFAAAGRAGASVLTHLLGQTVAELADKIATYRAAFAAAGHAGSGQVALMLHSFVGDDPDAVRDAVRQPLTDYLRTSTNLLKSFGWSFPAFRRRPGMTDTQPDLAGLDDDEMAALLDHAFTRYHDTGGLFGTPAHCLAMVDRVRAAGVDEIACLIDFGVPAQTVLDHLPALDRLRQLAIDPPQLDQSPVALMLRHGVTHLQCTPSLAQMLVADDAAAPALARLDMMMVGGEAFPPALARRLETLVGGTVVNMYGPTETTIWSTTHRLDGTPGAVPIGRPLANQACFVLDSRQQPVPPGIAGELVIAGAGVVRGYLGRPSLTAERFVPLPFLEDTRGYRTGDLVRQHADGLLDYLGRIDNQVKIRGHRIELGEIESVLAAHPAVAQAAVVAREDTPGDVRLIAYHVPAAGAAPDDLRAYLRTRLPEFMVPGFVVALPALPRTPNGKLDRAQLPPPEQVQPAAPAALAVPMEGLEARIATVWRDVLKLDAVGRNDNFFDIGGHSLLAVQLHRSLRDLVGRPLALTDIFRFPTVAALARHLADGEDDSAAQAAEARASGRRAVLRRGRTGARPALATVTRG